MLPPTTRDSPIIAANTFWVFAGRTNVNNKFLVTLACLAVSAIPCAHAADDVYDFELTPFGAYRFGGEFDVTGTASTLSLADSPSYGLLMNFRQHANTQWEIMYSRQQTDASAIGAPVNSSALDIDIHTLQGGGTYQGDGDTVRPYLAATLGGTHMKTSSEGAQSDTFFSFSLGVGLQIRPNDRLGLRLEARSYGILTDSKTDLFCATGPDQNICAIRIDGTVLWQLETMVGIVFRF